MNNIYFITNALAFLGFVILFIISLGLEGWTFKKITLKKVTVIGLFAALSVILTNAISYNIPVFPGGVKLALGDWILFLLGLMFGPLVGVISGIATDSLGAIVNIGSAYHFGFSLNKSLLGFFGAIVFLFKKNKLITLKIIMSYTFVYILESFILNPIWLYSIGWSDAVIVGVFVKLIKLPIALPIYLSLIFASFSIVTVLLKRWSDTEKLWCFRKGVYWEGKIYNLNKGSTY